MIALNSRKIILISDLHPTAGIGGGQLIAYEYYSALKKLNFNVEFWFASKGNSIYQPFIKGDLWFKPSKKKRLLFVFLGRVNLCTFIRSIIKNRGTTIWVNQIGSYWPFFIFLILRVLRFKVVFTFHDYTVVSKYKITAVPTGDSIYEKLDSLNLTITQKLRFYLTRFCINRSSINIAISQLQLEILNKLGVRVDFVIPNGIEKCSHSNREKIFNEKSDLQVLFAGRPLLKGLDILIKSILNSSYNWTIHLAGDPSLLDYATKLSIKNYIYHGPLVREDLFKLYHGVDLVFVCSQYLDAGPLIGLEALMHHTPFITTNLCGSSNIFKDDIAKKLVINSQTIPDLDSTFDYIKANYSRIINSKNNIKDVHEILRLYLNHLI